MKYAFIGLGNMATAILRGMRGSDRHAGDSLLGFDVLPGRAKELQEELGLIPAPSAADAAREAQVLVLAVKPQMMRQVLEAVKPALDGSKLLISIAAGLPLDFYEGILGADKPVARVMPSLNARVREAASAVCRNACVDEEQFALVKALFLSIGTVEELPEHLFGAFSAIAGAAPAFAFQFADALASAGVKAGLSRALAERTAAQMLLGSARLLQQSTEHPRRLMDQVCSPGGTTIEGVHALNRGGFDAAVQSAVDAVVRKDQSIRGKD